MASFSVGSRRDHWRGNADDCEEDSEWELILEPESFSRVRVNCAFSRNAPELCTRYGIQTGSFFSEEIRHIEIGRWELASEEVPNIYSRLLPICKTPFLSGPRRGFFQTWG